MKSITQVGNRAILAAACAAIFGFLPGARASLNTSYQFNGNGNWSIDAVGSNSSPVGDLTAIVPVGSTIEKAFLYSSLFSGAPTSVNFDGTTINSFTALGANGGLQAYRADVTAQVSAKVAGGSLSPFTFSVLSENPNGNIDGELLAIIYSNPGEAVRTIAFLDGFSNSSGDATGFSFGSPITVAPGFETLVSLGIGFGFQPSNPAQFSTVDVNGRRLTSSAGGYDDGISSNGGLITAGGLGDSPANPDPFANGSGGPFTDDELYDLAQGNIANPLPFLSTGDTGFTVTTQNPSGDDNIFFLGINTTGQGEVIDNPDAVPEPSTVIGGVAMAALAASRMLRRKKA